jgi:cell division protein FtsQ
MKRPEGFDPPAEQPPAERPSRLSKSPRSPRLPGQEKPERVRSTKTPSAPRATVRPEKDAAEISAKTEARAQRKLERAERRRFTRHTRRRRITRLTIIGVFVALLAILAVAIFSPLLALRTIRIEGTSKVSSAAVQSAVSSQLGTPLALIDQGRLRSELATFTLIRSYSTSIVPPHTLVIHVVEREAIGVVKKGKMFDQVDAAGVVLARSGTAAGLPVIDVRGAKPGSAAFQSVVRVLLAMPASVSKLIQTVSASTMDDVSLTLAGTTNLVVWGSADQSDLKALDLSRLLAQPTCKAQAVIDVSAPSVATCGPVRVQPTQTPTPTSSGAPNGG